MMSFRTTGKNLWCIRTVFVVVSVSALLVLLPSPAEGGLLSAILRRGSNFPYVVQRVVYDNEDSVGRPRTVLDKSSNAIMEENGRRVKYKKGPATSATVYSSSSEIVGLKTEYSDCGSVAAIKSLQLSPCAKKSGSDSGICEIERGSNVTFNLSFVPKSNASQLKAVIHGIIDYVPVPLPCPEPNACENSGLTCPLEAGQQYDYVLSAQVKESYPKMKLWVKGQLEDEQVRNVICVKIHVHIV